MAKIMYNHAFNLSFSIVTDKSCDPENERDWPSAKEVAAAIRSRVDQLLICDEIIEAIGLPWDTFSYELTEAKK